MLNNSLNAKIPVSVIIPCYNCGTTISRAVRSVAEQTQKPQELILVDDGSQDNTNNILNDLQAKFGKDWIKLVEHPQNRGPSSARNAGWDSAICPYIAFLDSDDSWHSEKLAIQYGYMINHPDVVLTGHRWILAKDRPGISSQLKETMYIISISKLKSMLVSKFFSSSTVMLKREVSCRYPEDMRYSEDRFLYLRIILEGNKAAYISTPLGYLHKIPYGGDGLTKSLWKMEKGELRGFCKLYGLKLLDKHELLICITFSLIKFIRRGCLISLKKLSMNRRLAP